MKSILVNPSHLVMCSEASWRSMPSKAHTGKGGGSGSWWEILLMFFSRCGETDFTTDCSLAAANLRFGSSQTLVCSG